MKFIDPYVNLNPDQRHRTTIDISGEVKGKISAIRPQRGTLQTTLNILLDKLTHELTNAGITEYNPALYEQAVADSAVVLGGGSPATVGGPDGAAKATDRDDRSRASGVARESATPPPISSNPNVPPARAASGQRRQAINKASH